MAPQDRPKLVISLDDLDDAPPPVAPPAAVAPGPAPVFPTVNGAQATPLPLGGGSLPAVSTGVALGSIKARNLVAALVGMALGWAVTEITGLASPEVTSEAAMNFWTGIWVAVLGLCFSVVFVGWEHVEARSGPGLLLVLRRVGPWGAGLGFIAGWLANVIFIAFLEQAIESGSDGTLYLARIIGWGIFGLGVGATTGALIRAREKIINGALGGLAGGAAAGLVFEYLTRNVASLTFARLLGLLVTAAAIGFAIGVVEAMRRQAWFKITGGGMAGKEFVLYETETPVGSSPLCAITLIKDPGVQPYHFVISGTQTGPRRVLTAYEGAGVTINGTPVAQHQLRNGDVIGVGTTTIAYAERTI